MIPPSQDLQENLTYLTDGIDLQLIKLELLCLVNHARVVTKSQSKTKALNQK